MTDEPNDSTEPSGRTRPTPPTRASEREDAAAAHGAPQRPSDEEAAAAERASRDPEAEQAYRDYLRKAAAEEGEGRIP